METTTTQPQVKKSRIAAILAYLFIFIVWFMLIGISGLFESSAGIWLLMLATFPYFYKVNFNPSSIVKIVIWGFWAMWLITVNFSLFGLFS